MQWYVLKTARLGSECLWVFLYEECCTCESEVDFWSCKNLQFERLKLVFTLFIVFRLKDLLIFSKFNL